MSLPLYPRAEIAWLLDHANFYDGETENIIISIDYHLFSCIFNRMGCNVPRHWDRGSVDEIKDSLINVLELRAVLNGIECFTVVSRGTSVELRKDKPLLWLPIRGSLCSGSQNCILV